MATKRPRISWSDDEESDQKQEKEPFREPDEHSDIVLIVEGTKLHVHKWVLASYSEVFQRMFESGFKERGEKEIPLPGKQLELFVKFLQQMYPVSSLEPITDEIIADILALADEYQVEHIRRKCEQYIESQLTSQGQKLTTDQKLLYLWMSDVYGYKGLRGRLVVMTAETDLPDLQKSQHYPSLPLAATKDVMLKRCQKLEGENKSLRNSLTSEKAAHTRLQGRMNASRSFIEKFFEKFSIRSNCSQGAGHKTKECDGPYNTEKYCTFCASQKAEKTILNLLK